MKIFVKICGIQTIEDAEIAIKYGADFIGINFVPISKRSISIESAGKVIESAKKSVKIVGIFQDHQISEVNSIGRYLNLDYVQLHGSESPEYCHKISIKIIKAFSLEQSFDTNRLLTLLKNYQVAYFLLDRKIQGQGPILEQKLLKKVSRRYPIFIAGGLNPKNITQTIKISKPFAVDVSTGIETDGKIDFIKVRHFIQNAKSINYY